MHNNLLVIDDIVVHRNGEKVFEAGELSIQKGEILAVIGPNGSGKSTLLLAIAQLILLTKGSISFNGETITPANTFAFRRKIGMVLQAPLLLDASVFDNIALGLKFRKISKRKIAPQVESWMARLGISHLKDRRAREISAGEAQRVSIARALILKPELLLLDEPFTSLDKHTRVTLLNDFHSLLKDLDTTVIFVTHDLDEALFIGDRVAVIIDGKLCQHGLAEEVFTAPHDSQIAAFIGVETVISGQVVKSQAGEITVRSGEIQIEALGDMRPGQTVLVCLRSEDVTLWIDHDLPMTSARNLIEGSVNRITSHGPMMKIIVDCPYKRENFGAGSTENRPVQIVALITRNSFRELEISQGKKVSVTFKATAVHLVTK